MWILESKGDFFQGRRMWLKPGKQYLFGRAKKDGVRFALDHKTVSRKHFIITVAPVKDYDVGNAYAFTKVTITDQGSKSGTSVNGENARETRTLTKSENFIKLGTCAEELIIRWEPKVLTWNLLKKELKSGVLKTKQQRVQELDVKAISDYIPGTTTHCIVSKRNTAKGLQCLIDAKHLVAESYIDALEYAATPADLNEEENLSPLEQDFEQAWPSEKDHLPEPGKEPTVRPAESYQPNENRKNVFEKFTFVFGDQTQYDNLLPPITTGHGKALLFKVVDGETTVDDLLTYMQNAAGSKGFGDMDQDTDAGGVILVRWTSKTNEQWSSSLINEVSLRLDQRAIEQGEFLDAILANDASLLRRAVPYDTNSNGQIASSSTDAPINKRGSQQHPGLRVGKDETQQTSNASLTLTQTQPGPAHRPADDQSQATSQTLSGSQPINRALILGSRKKNRLKDFDDGFDEDAVVPYDEDEDEAGTSQTQREASAVHDENSNDHVANSEPVSSRKRAHSTGASQSIENEDDLDDLLPAAAAVKRLKNANGRAVQRSSTSGRSTRSGVALSVPRSKNKPELDVKEELRAKREATRNLDEEEERPIEFDEDGKLPVFEVQTDLVDLPAQRKPIEDTTDKDTERWDPKWNGRKNFKAFRRARDANGQDEPRRRTHTRVIVPLVDARPATYGIGDQYWDKTDGERERRKKSSQRTSQSQQSSNRTERLRADRSSSINDGVDGDEPPEPSSHVSLLQQEAAAITDHVIDIDEPRQTRAGDHGSGGRSVSSGSTQDTSTTAATRGTKRSTAVSSSKSVAPKRQKLLPVTTVHGSDSGSDDSDDMKFKFGRSRRSKARTKG